MRTLMTKLWILTLVVTACATTTEPPGTAEVAVNGAQDDGSGWVNWHEAQVSPPIVMGPQGGQHVWVVVSTSTAFQAKRVRVTVRMTDLDTGEVVKPGDFQFTKDMVDAPDGRRTPAITAYVKEPCKVAGRHVRVHVDVEDLVGLTGSAEATITPTWNGFCAP